MAQITILDNGNKLHQFTSVNDAVLHLDFLEEARNALNEVRGVIPAINAEQFFITVIKTINLGDQGLVGILTSKNNKPLGFGCAFNAVDFGDNACFYVWQVYSNNKCATTIKDLLNFCKSYAKVRNHTVLKMSTPRNTGAALRYFQDKLGFDRESIVFSTTI